MESNIFIIKPLQVERIKLSHDHMEYGIGFHVKEVEIDVPSYGNHYTFPCNCWLAQDKLTEMTVKDLNSSAPAPSKTKLFPGWEGEEVLVPPRPMLARGGRSSTHKGTCTFFRLQVNL